MNKTVVINVVWGEEYNRFFVEHSLSTFLAKGNLEVLQGGCYRLYTTATDAAFIKESSSAKHLNRYVNEFAFRLNEGNVRVHTLNRLDSFVEATFGRHITYKELIA